MGSMGWGSGAGLLWYILMMLRISRLGSGRDAGPEGFTTGGSFFGFGVCFFGFGSGGGKGGAGAIGSNSFKHQANKSTGEILLSHLILPLFHSLADRYGLPPPCFRIPLPKAQALLVPLLLRLPGETDLFFFWLHPELMLIPGELLLISLPGSPLHVILPASGLGLGFSSVFFFSSSSFSSCFG